MKNKITHIQFNIISYDFILRPLSILTTNFPKAAYSLEFLKGPQQFKTFGEVILLQNSKEFIFANNEQVRVKLHNPKHATFAWMLYRENNEFMKQYLDQAKFNLNDYYQSYIQEIRQHSSEYSKIVADKINGHPIRTSWKNIKDHLKNCLSVKEVTNKSGSLKVKFSMQIRSELDDISDQQSIKCKISSRGSFESDCKSNSSNNSLNGIRKKTIVKLQEKSNEIKEVKVDLTIKEEAGNLHKNSLRVAISSISSPPNTLLQQIPQQEHQAITPITPYFPALKNDFINNTNLSYVSQKSNDGFLRVTTNEKRSNQKSAQKQEINEQKINHFFLKKKTLTIDIDQFEQDAVIAVNHLQKHPQTSDFMKEGSFNQQHSQHLEYIQGDHTHHWHQQPEGYIQDLQHKNNQEHSEYKIYQKQDQNIEPFKELENTVQTAGNNANNKPTTLTQVRRPIISIKTIALLIPILLAILSCIGLFMHHTEINQNPRKSKSKFSKGKNKIQASSKSKK